MSCVGVALAVGTNRGIEIRADTSNKMIVRLGSFCCRLRLFSALAPRTAELLRDVAALGIAFPVRHATYSGPEISCPINASEYSLSTRISEMTLENPVHEPDEGDLVVVCAAPGRWGHFPTFPLIDVGIFYSKGGRLSFPFGNIEGCRVGQIDRHDLADLQAAAAQIQSNHPMSLKLEMAL